MTAALAIGATLGDLAAMGQLAGRTVRFLATDIETIVPAGSVGTVLYSKRNKAMVRFEFPDRHDRYPWKCVPLETKLYNLELVNP